MGNLISNVPPKVPSSHHGGQPPPPEELVCLDDIALGYHQYALGRLWEVSLWGSSYHNYVEVGMYMGKGTPGSSVVSVQWLCILWVRC